VLHQMTSKNGYLKKIMRLHPLLYLGRESTGLQPTKVIMPVNTALTKSSELRSKMKSKVRADYGNVREL
jgi:hypothetical protein